MTTAISEDLRARRSEISPSTSTPRTARVLSYTRQIRNYNPAQ
jgi:hypothetical protein